MPLTEDERVNSKLSKFKLVLEKLLIDSKNNIEWIFHRVGHLNDKVQVTKYLLSHHPEWIGCTALHFSAHFQNREAYEILINKGADFTLQNNDGATALHVAIEKNSDKSMIADFFVHSILSAHLKYNNFKNPCNKNGLSHFHIACLTNQVELVEQFLNHGVCINHAVNMDSTHFPGYTPLHFAAEYRCFEVTRVLLTHSADTKIKDARGTTPMHLLLEKNLEIADPVITEKFKPTILSQIEKNQQKYIAELKRCLEIVVFQSSNVIAAIIKLFFVLNTDENTIIDDTGLSYLHLSCTIRDVKEVEHMLEKVVDINHYVNMNSPHWPGYTALHFAAHSDIDTVRFLLKNGAKIEAKDAKGVTPLDICLRRYEPADVCSIVLLKSTWKGIVLSDGKTRLSDFLNAMRDPDNFKKFLRRLPKERHIHVPNNSPLWPGFSPMHIAVALAKRELLEADQSMLQMLQELFGRTPTLLQHQEVRGGTPLHLAYRLQKVHLIKLFIKYHQTLANFSDIVDEDGLSYMHIAAMADNDAFLENLLANGANVNAVYKGTSSTWRGVYTGSTPLHFAVAYNSGKVIEKLVFDYGADIYAKDDNDMTPIHLLVTMDHEDYGNGHFLLNLPDLEDSIVSHLGLSHLHVACLGGYFLSTKSLVENGANIHQMLTMEPIKDERLSCLNDHKGCTPIKIAFEKGCQECVNVLMKHDPEFLNENYSLIYGILAGRYNCAVLLPQLETDKGLQARLKTDIGLTALHVACWGGYLYRKESLNCGADVNVQIHEDSPVWPGWTPVHVYLMRKWFCDATDDFLIEAGIDVTLSNVEGETAVHMAYRLYQKDGFYEFYVLLNKLLQAQKDFGVNPTSTEGITHFHVACAIGNAPVVEKFLQQSSIDVNLPIDFLDENAGGQTPLHLAVSSKNKFIEASMQLQTVELLLKYGANVHAEDSCGNTALHECARAFENSYDIFERIAKEGADVNARNILGHTPLKYILSNKTISIEEIKTLLRLGCHFNTFNPVTEEGCLGPAIYSIPRKEIECLVATLKTHSSLTEMDDTNRTIIHNIVSTMETKVPVDKYITLIEQLSRIEYDVDDQDRKGRSPLHMAVKFQNVQGISALLLAGADVNLVDVHGITAFHYCFRGCDQCEWIFDSCGSDIDEYENIVYDDGDAFLKCRHIEMFKLLAIHIRKLLYWELDVSQNNKNDSDKAFYMSNSVRNFAGRFVSELEEIKKIAIVPNSLNLSDLLSENAVIDYPTMSFEKRTSLNNFFLSSKIHTFREKFKETAGIIQLQYRKAVMRVHLLERAKDSLTILAGFRLDDLCSQIILKLLKNSELRHLIESTNSEKDMQMIVHGYT